MSDAGAKESGESLVEPEKRQSVRPAVLLPTGAGKKSGLERAMGFVRTVAPVVRKVLPLLDGNVVSAVSNFLAPRAMAPRVNLEPLEIAVTKMRKDHLDLRLNVADQTAALKRIADQVQSVKDTTERNSLEQKELAQDLKTLGSRVNLVAWIGLGLLALSILVNVVLFLRIERVAH
jgi:hypothetical protein